MAVLRRLLGGRALGRRRASVLRDALTSNAPIRDAHAVRGNLGTLVCLVLPLTSFGEASASARGVATTSTGAAASTQVRLAATSTGVRSGAISSASDDRSIYDIDLGLDLSILVVGLTGVVVPYALGGVLIEPRCPCSPEGLNALDRSVVGRESPTAYFLATLGVGAALTLPFLAEGLELGLSRAFFEDAVILAQALAVNAALVSVTKVLVQRPLPLVYADGRGELARGPEGYRAFYSGHVSNAVAVTTAYAVTQTLRRGPRILPWVAVAVTTVGISAGVISSGRHFYTDVFVGAAVGALVGVAVPLAHRRSAPRIVLHPTAGGLQLGVGARF